MLPLSDAPHFELKWHLPRLRAPEAWAWNQGSGALVAVVDTGVIRVDELGLEGGDGVDNLLPAMEIPPVETIVLPDGASVDVAHDDVGHDTHIASTIAQRADNGIGGAGIAPDASILPIRAMGQSGGSRTDIADAICYAADNGAQVINLSLGSPVYSEAIAEACQYAADAGVVLVAASGNDGTHCVSYPSVLDTTLAVGAVGPESVVTDYSTRGPELDVVAPGGALYDFDRNGVYVGGCFHMGPSSATATMSGVAALLVAEGATREEVMDLLTTTAVDVSSPGWDADHGWGMVDAASALEAFAGPAPDPEPTLRTAEEFIAGDLMFTELMADPAWRASDSCEWFEVENTSDTGVDLGGLAVRDAGGSTWTIDTSVVLSPRGAGRPRSR